MTLAGWCLVKNINKIIDMNKINLNNRKQLITGFLILSVIAGIFFFSCKTQPDNKDVGNTINQPLNSGQHLEWFRDAKFGMFIHWGPYSRLAGEWNDRQVPVGKNAEWIMKILAIPVNEYRELAHKLNPVRFDAHEWVHLAKAAGMKYIVITAKHHDGFAMYKSKVSAYNIVDWTPFKRDPLKELSEACAEEGIKFCIYYSHREDWDHPGGYGNNWDYDNDWGADFFDSGKFEKYLEEKAKPQLRELLTDYGPIGLVWFDRGMYTPEQGKEFVSLVHGLQPATLINGRVGHYDQEFLGDYQSMSDNGMPPGGIEEYWETPMTLNDTWGFSKFDTLWKNPETVIQRLIEIVSRGGNYLLNIGPKGNGEIPDATIEIFRKVGPWVERNAESIYGTTANPFGELTWGYCTVRGTKLYLFVRDWPKDGVLSLSGLKNRVTSASLLIDKSMKLTVTQVKKQTRIKLPLKPPDNPVSVLVLELDGIPGVDPPVVLQDESGEIELNYLTAITKGKTMTRFNRKGGFHISKWTAPEDAVDWSVNVKNPGKFKVMITYAASREWEGKQYEINVGGSHIEKPVIYTGDWYEYREFPIGYVELPKPGNYTLTIRPKVMSDTYLMYLSSLALVPVKNSKQAGWSVN
jgi:alpha-L-fucosidase